MRYLKVQGEKRSEDITLDDVFNAKGCPRMLLRNNRNWVALLCGPTGTGKSYTALRLAELLDPEFNVHRCVFSTKEFLEVFHTCHPGDFIIFDEGEEFNARRGMKESNVQMGIIMAMLRFTQVNVIFTLPTIHMIDINARRLAHSYLYTIEVDRHRAVDWKRSRSGVYWYNIQNSRLPSKNSDDGLKFVNPLVKGKKVRKVWFEAPDEDLLARYESKKHDVFYRTLSEAQQKLGMNDASVESAIRADRDRPPEPETPSAVDPRLAEESDVLEDLIMTARRVREEAEGESD